MKNYLTMLVLAVGICLGGYAFAEHHEHAGHGAEAHQGMGNMKEAGNKICPVDGEKIGSMGKPVNVEHEGKTYNLCCAACEMKFKEDPAKYIEIVNKQLEVKASEPADESKTQVTGDSMAKICPVCGPEEGMSGKDDITYEYEGKTYYFCTKDCLASFKKNPGKFSKKMDEAMNKESHEDGGHKSHSGHKDHDGHGHK